MTTSQRNWAVFLGSMAATYLISTLVLLVSGVTDESIRLVLRLSARTAFVVLLIVFVARPLRQMFKTPYTAMLLRNRRLLGIAFAGIHTAHLGLIVYRSHMSDDFEFSVGANLLGALTYFVILLMFVTSFDRAAKLLGPKNWRLLHKLGLFWLFVTFSQTQLPDPVDDWNGVNWTLIALIVAALVIRMTAYFAKSKSTALP